MTGRNNPMAFRRTNRAHGVTKKDAELMKQFEYAKSQNPPTVSLEPVYIKPACRCPKYLFPHVHSGGEA